MLSLRWLELGVAHLTSAPCWVIYLQMLQEAVWPGGTLPAQPRAERSASEREETKRQCLNCLMRLIPGRWNRPNSIAQSSARRTEQIGLYVCLCRACHRPAGKRQVQAELGDGAGVVTGAAHKQVSEESDSEATNVVLRKKQRDKIILLD